MQENARPPQRDPLDTEWKFINEYDPFWPNDYEKVVKGKKCIILKIFFILFLFLKIHNWDHSIFQKWGKKETEKMKNEDRKEILKEKKREERGIIFFWQIIFIVIQLFMKVVPGNYYTSINTLFCVGWYENTYTIFQHVS